MVVLVTGANGQLGQSIQFIANKYPNIQFVYTDFQEMDITNLESCQTVFSKYKPQFCINTAAYTAVDKAESESEKAHLINAVGAENLAKVCKEFDTILLHISTDFIFDGTSTSLSLTTGYKETDIPNPQSIYGQTKLDGELAIQKSWEKHFIVRTSWVYSQFANNFMKTMLRLASERDSLSVVNDQIGTPTNAVDLAEVLLTIIQSPITHHPSFFGIYNFSNEGVCSWYDFAKEIFHQKGISIDLQPIPTSAYPTLAKRPTFSVLDKSKIKTTFPIAIADWKTSLKKCLELL
ncbi:dTDP-4-dehydrorhamnose reductase [Flavobacterium tibetense]|jgi:dTDP-4-dehydrorhamnose reductase|uniref:dTDP-4-dehydrorhamnose reductase n=1 Tax=Flavobacterium tibetense TaxID=2233533 RepID=A0A365P535_9FLAO|nr:dTDP-4-dehydrorhamnose reductase [Flavobacterium tibetense]RBA29695.1 dTDP-4-dehydrorhamnose reductase [Flavobacterium tibetense]